jgi:Domain of unknown function (DUF4907)
MKFIYFFLVMCCALSCSEQVENKVDERPEPEQITATKETYRVISVENGPGSFGYQILKDGKMLINQATIPAIQGNQGFSSREKAQKTGEFVLQKIEKGFFPPTISPEELDSLGVL